MSAIRSAALALLAALAGGCLPMVPIPGGQGAAPYDDTVLFGLVPGVSTREQVERELGKAPLSRLGGRLLVYGAARQTGGRLLIIAPPFIPVTVPWEEFHFLFLEMDDRGVLVRRELVVSGSDGQPGEVCDATGVCLLDAAFTTEGAVPLWMRSGDLQHGARARVTASTAAEQGARAFEPPERGCVLYFANRPVPTDWLDTLLNRAAGVTWYQVDERPRYVDPGDRVFARWLLGPGRHVVRASARDGALIDETALDCADGGIFYVVGETLPTFGAWGNAARLLHVEREEFAELLVGRRLLME